MATFLTYLLGLLVVGGVLFLLASFAFGRGEELAPMPPDGTPVELPDGRFGSEAIRALRISVVLRGYRMDEVDWILEMLGNQLDDRDTEITRLRAAAGDHSAAALTPLDPDPADEPDAGSADAELADGELMDTEPADAELADGELADAELTEPADEQPARAGAGSAPPAAEDGRDG